MSEQPDLDPRIAHLRKMSEAALKELYEARRNVEARQRDLAMLSMDMNSVSASALIAPMPVVGKHVSDEIREQSWALRCDYAAIVASERIWRDIYEVTR